MQKAPGVKGANTELKEPMVWFSIRQLIYVSKQLAVLCLKHCCRNRAQKSQGEIAKS